MPPKGSKMSEEAKKKISLANKGKKRTEDMKKKMSDIKKGSIGYRKGIPHTEETKKKISTSKKKNPNRYWLGKHRSNETKRKISKAHLQNPVRYWLGKKRECMTKENNPNWKGGISVERAAIWHSQEYKKWRKSVFERDNYTCQECQLKNKALEAHHIKAFAKYPKLRLDIDNGITLCKECHKATRGKEEKFENYFINKLNNFKL